MILRLAFVLLLYGFLFSLVMALRRDLRDAARPAPAGDARAEGTPRPRAPRARLIVLEPGSSGVDSGRTFPLLEQAVIGRAPESDIHLDDRLISGQHARLRAVDGRWLLRDLGSTNGTLLNQQPIEGERPVEFGDVIGVGGVRLKLSS